MDVDMSRNLPIPGTDTICGHSYDLRPTPAEAPSNNHAPQPLDRTSLKRQAAKEKKRKQRAAKRAAKAALEKQQQQTAGSAAEKQKQSGKAAAEKQQQKGKARGDLEVEPLEAHELDMSRVPLFVGAQATILALTENWAADELFLDAMEAIRKYNLGQYEGIAYMDPSDMTVAQAFMAVEKGTEEMAVARYKIYSALCVMALRALE